MRVISWLWDIGWDTLAFNFIIYVHCIFFWKGARWDLARAADQPYPSSAEREAERLHLVFLTICHYKGDISPPSSDCYLLWDRNRILHRIEDACVLLSSCGRRLMKQRAIKIIPAENALLKGIHPSMKCGPWLSSELYCARNKYWSCERPLQQLSSDSPPKLAQEWYNLPIPCTIWRNNKIHLTAQDQTCENQLNEPSREHWVNTTYRNRFFSCWRRRHALFCLHLTSTRHKRNLHTHTETVNLFLFVPCT